MVALSIVLFFSKIKKAISQIVNSIPIHARLIKNRSLFLLSYFYSIFIQPSFKSHLLFLKHFLIHEGLMKAKIRQRLQSFTYVIQIPL